AVCGHPPLAPRDRRPQVGRGRALVRAVAEAEVRGDRDRGEDRKDDHHDEELDQGEALLAPQPFVQLVQHLGSFPWGNRGGRLTYRWPAAPGRALDRVMLPSKTTRGRGLPRPLGLTWSRSAYGQAPVAIWAEGPALKACFVASPGAVACTQ